MCSAPMKSTPAIVDGSACYSLDVGNGGGPGMTYGHMVILKSHCVTYK